jgi:3-oxoacyl-[acyl-carrier-protein] synthase II
MSGPVCVTGMGIVSAIGHNLEETYASLAASKTGIRSITHLESIHKSEFLAGEVTLSNEELKEKLGITQEGYGRGALLGILAAREALLSAGITDTTEARTGLISSTSVAGMSTTENYYRVLFTNTEHISCLDAHDCGDITERISGYTGISHHLSTISTACSSAANAIMLGARLIRNGLLDRVLVGGADSLSKFTLNGFNTLKILDTNWCRPFSDDRAGLNLGEGAAFLVLESEEQLKRTQKPILGRVVGYGNANDAFHQTASSPEGLGAELAMRKALKVSGLDVRAIDYVNAHGTGTPNNDLSEGKALLQIFGQAVPKFSSTKAYTGHTLAPAAAIEAVISLLSMQHNCIFPNLNYSGPMKEFNLVPVTQLLKNVELNYILSNSFGFGGNCSSLIFSKN